MTDDNLLPFCFPVVHRKKITAAFDGGRVSSDGGVMLLAQAERRLGIADQLARMIPDVLVPAAIADAGEHAVRRFLEFFAATIRNRNTRTAYYRACCSFFAWLEQRGIDELPDIEPIHVATYIETLQATAKPTVKQHLAAIRHLFDWLVVGQMLAINPAHAVRGSKHVVRPGKTPFLTEDQARRLIDGLDISTMVGLRERALIGMMTYTFARIGAVVGMRVQDYYPQGKRFWVRLHEKGGKQHEMPVHHNLEEYLVAYLDTPACATIPRGRCSARLAAAPVNSPAPCCRGRMPMQ